MTGVRFPGETDGYRAARDRLLGAELELRRQTERVAEMRRALPLGGTAPTGYVFTSVDPSGERKPVKLSELFGSYDTLVLYNFMYGREAANPCPMCTSFLDGLNGNLASLDQRVSVAVVARSPIERIVAFAKKRGWRLRMLSSADNDFNRDYHGEDADGAQNPMLHVFVRRNGTVHHTWSSELQMAPTDPGQNQRHLDTMWPLWNVLDCTPEGRGTDWYPKLRV